MKKLEEVKKEAKKIMLANNLNFATIWKTKKSIGFNFDKKEIGYSIKEYGIKRTVIDVIS